MNDVIILVVGALLASAFYWSFFLLPGRRELKKRQQMVSQLQPGDSVVTFGGMIGTLLAVDVNRGVVQVEIADGVVVQLMLVALMQPYNPENRVQDSLAAVDHEPNTTVEL